ncbi:MAG: FapA family protein [bacterium]|nr:FapA family protein [bacterium]MDY4099521.1 FapA family protein [Lachnospiraceae bacterium]
MPLPMPDVRITEDYMEAYMTVPPTGTPEKYTVEYLTEVLHLNHVKIGILTESLQKIIDNNIYNKEVLVAQGAEPQDGKDGYFEYLFDTELSQKPIEQADGSVDYKNIKMIELVEPGQKIAIYHPGTAGTNGYNLAAQFRLAKRGAELPPLKGTGFERLEDGITYRATVGGKITELNNRVNIFQVHELYGDVDLSSGNIDFNGDVIVHGNVLDGMSVKATGTITIDKVVESACVDGRKGVILRGGVLGKNGAKIRSKGNITAQFIEYADVKTEGDIEADSFLDSHVYAGGKIKLNGKKGCIVGGTTHAVRGIEARAIGNSAGANTEVSVGVHQTVYEQIQMIDREARDDERQLQRIEEGLVQFETIMRQKGLSFRDDPRRMALVKEKVRLSAQIAGRREEMQALQQVISASTAACVQVVKFVYPGARVCVDEQNIRVKETQRAVEFKKYMGRIGMFNIGYTSN